MSASKLKFYGTRGSIPICHPDFQEFGGNTTSIALYREDEGKISILDAGSGIRQLGRDINRDYPDQEDLFIAFSHFHWDHIQGFPFFDPAYKPNMKINILAFGLEGEVKDLREILSMQMQKQYFPVPLDHMGCQFNFLLQENNQVEINGATIKTILQNHPGGSQGYRIEFKSKAIVICTDCEHGETVNNEIVTFAENADLLIHEAQYTDEQLSRHRGWGHSSYSQAIEVAEKAGVKHLIMTHHDPDHNDDFLRRQEKNCQDRFKNCELAREGMEVTF